MKYNEITKTLTLHQKSALLSGKTVWETWDFPEEGVKSLFLADGPNGIRKQEGASDHLGLNESVKATCFPTAATVANSWDVELSKEIGRVLGREASSMAVDVVLGPGLNIKRSPLCGRNFEYFSEDPYLSGKLAAAYVRGIQSVGVSACPKHFAANSQELCRMSTDSVIDERTLREIYLTGFEIAVKESEPDLIMSAYNKVNGTYANENRFLLTDILRGEWGFEGFVVTDWGGSNDHVEGVKNGSALEMPYPGLDSARQLVSAVESGRLEESAIDERVNEILRIVEKAGNRTEIAELDLDQHHDIARKAAEGSIVLLKNDERLLPLKSGTSVAIIGDFAQKPRYQGAGSSMVNSHRVENAVDLAEEFGINCIGYEKGFRRHGGEDTELLNRAMELAGRAEVVLLYMGLPESYESEGMDRTHIKLAENQVILLEALYRVNPNIVVILAAGAPVDMSWAEYGKAILHGYLGGQAGAGAMLNVVTGRVNPSGKLNESYPLALADAPCSAYYPGRRVSAYRESLFVGYRYYSTIGKKVAYPFGYGLSYTTFEYSDLKVDADGVSFNLTNSGEVDGAEIAQLYIGKKDSVVIRPARELKGFAKLKLAAGETVTVRIPFDDKSFRYYNVESAQWQIEGGEYQIYIGASVEDIRLSGAIMQEGSGGAPLDMRAMLPSYDSGRVENISDAEFETLLGRLLTKNSSQILTLNDTLGEMENAKGLIPRLVAKFILHSIKQGIRKGEPNLNAMFQYNMPFRAIAKMTNGVVSMEMVDGILMVVNGHFCRGAYKVIGGFFSNRRLDREFRDKLNRTSK